MGWANAAGHALAALDPNNPHAPTNPGRSFDAAARGDAAYAATVGTGSATFNPLDPSHSGAPGVVAKSAPVAAVVGTSQAIIGAASSIDSIEKALKFLFSYRFLEIVGGGALIIVGIVGLMKEVGVNVPSPVPKVG
jgi:hypothetical protein